MKFWFSREASSPEKGETERLIFWLGISLFVLFACWAVFLVPMANDEVNHYHLLACINDPFSSLGSSQMRGCDHRFDLTTPFGLVIERSLLYIGILPSVLYAPFYFLFHSMLAQYLFGLCFFVVFALMFSRLTPRPDLILPVILAFLPLSFNFIHDMGPVKYAMITFPLGVLLVRKTLLAPSPHHFFYAVFLAILLFMGVEEKPFYFYLFPGLFFFLLAFAGESFGEIIKNLNNSRRALGLSVIVFIGLLVMLLFSTLPKGNYYITELILMMRGEDYILPMLDVGLSWGERWLRFLFFWPYYFHRFFNLEIMDDHGNYLISFRELISFCILPIILFLFSMVAALVAWKNDKITRVSSRTILLVLSFISNILAFTFLGKIWASHHFIFIWLPLLVLFADLIARVELKWQMALITLFYVINFLPWLWITKANFLDEVSRDRQAIGSYFDQERSEKSIINYPTSWGYHLLQAQYGPSNAVITRLSMKPEEIKALFRLSEKIQRQIYIVCYNDTTNIWLKMSEICDKGKFENLMSHEMNEKIILEESLPGLQAWHIYKVVQQ